MAEVTVSLLADAELDLVLAKIAQHRPRAAAALHAAWVDALADLSITPEIAPTYDGRHRRLQLPRHPYGIFYRLTGDDVRVVCFAHDNQNVKDLYLRN